jgi:photosystem II stability/assembly factor-like uncharacterized protein
MKFTFIYLFALILIQPNLLMSQWVIMDGSPEEEGIFRFDDVFFTDEDHGSLISPNGYIYTTFDRGVNWIQSTKINAYLRAIEYASPYIGIASSLQGITVRTTDGGLKWEDISNRIPGNHKGMCGLHYVDGWFYGVGVFHAPARFFRSSDFGDTWEVFELDSISFGLVDVYFLDSLKGFICGTGTQSAFLPEEGSIWYTEDGGISWNRVGSTGKTNTYIWKMDFVSKDTIYATVENYLGNTPAYMKSCDGGANWTYHEIEQQDIGFFDAQAIGFLDPLTGWLAGYGTGMYHTNDGGTTWTTTLVTNNVNRFFKVNPNFFLASGLRLYQYDGSSAIAEEINPRKLNPPHQIIWKGANPIENGHQSFEIILDEPGMALLGLYNSQGQLAKKFHHAELPAGRYSFELNGTGLLPGAYFLSLRTYERHLYLKLIR